jgi:hypothetical protein
VVHQFFNGPKTTEALFINQGVLEFVDPDRTDKVIRTIHADEVVRTYYESCEAARLSRPNLLQSGTRTL